MDFILTHGFDLAPHAAYLESCAVIQIDSVRATNLQGAWQHFLSGRVGSVVITGTDVRFLDGQCSVGGRLHHPVFRHGGISRAVETALKHDGSIPNGIFCAGRISRDEGSSARFTVTTDWLGQYPIYWFTHRGRFAVSNNLLMIERVCGASRSILAAVEQLVTAAGPHSDTCLEGVRRLPIGSYLEASEADGLRVSARPDHGLGPIPYPDALALARKEIAGHIACVLSEVSDSYIVTDLTGGSDSRAVLSFLLEHVDRERLNVRCMGRYPSPDANVAAFLMDTLELPACQFPTAHLSPDFFPRMNAATSGGAKDSGSILLPVGFSNLVHFTGSFGELGGATPGSDYISEAFAQGQSLSAAVDLFISRRRLAKALELLTDEGVAYGRAALIEHYERLLEAGTDKRQLLAERYLRSRCRSHFGLMSYLENKSRILPEPLANRWLVEARRSVDPELAYNNKVIYDLVRSSKNRELAFYPMANKKWSEHIVPTEDRVAYDAMPVIDFKSAELSQRKAPLYRLVAIGDVPLDEYEQLPLRVDLEGSCVTPQLAHLSLNKAMLRFFLDNLHEDDDAWRLISRAKVLESIEKPLSEFRPDGIDVNAMGSVASAFAWKLGLEIKPALRDVRSFAPT